MSQTTPKKIRRKKSELQKAKEKLWQLCREIIIQKYGSKCYTCSSLPRGSALHVGHFIPSSISSVEMRYSLDNLRPQCYRCNIHLSGNWPEYERHLKADGIDVEEIKQRNRNTTGKQYDILWYNKKIEDYEIYLREMSEGS